MRVETCEEVGIVVGSPKEERVVYNAISSSDGEFLFQCLQGGCLWHGVWHVEEGGDATGGSCTALGSHVCLLRQSWLAEVYVVVDDAGQQKTTLRIQCLIDIRWESLVVCIHIHKKAIFNKYVGLQRLTIAYDGYILY